MRRVGSFLIGGVEGGEGRKGFRPYLALLRGDSWLSVPEGPLVKLEEVHLVPGIPLMTSGCKSSKHLDPYHIEPASCVGWGEAGMGGMGTQLRRAPGPVCSCHLAWLNPRLHRVACDGPRTHPTSTAEAAILQEGAPLHRPTRAPRGADG